MRKESIESIADRTISKSSEIRGTNTASAVRLARELHVRQSDSPDEDAIGSDAVRRLKAGASHRRDQVVLIDAVAADPDCSDKPPVLIERNASGEYLQAILKTSNSRAACLRLAVQHTSEGVLYKIELQAIIERAELVDPF